MNIHLIIERFRHHSDRELLLEILALEHANALRLDEIETILEQGAGRTIAGFTATSKDNQDMTTTVVFTATGIKDKEGNALPDGPFLASDHVTFSLVGQTGSGVFAMNADGTSATITGANEGDTWSYHCVDSAGNQIGTDIPWTVGGGSRTIGGFSAASTDVP